MIFGLAAALLAAALAAGACASVQQPPGGEEDKTPPQLLATRPDTFARLQGYTGPVVFVFSEGLSAQNVEEAVTVSPRTSPVAVDKSGDEIRVSLRRGWERGRVYQVNIASQVRDLFGNTIAAPIRLVFSTGPDIPNTRATGTVVQRTTGQPLPGARVEATLLSDSLVYTVVADSAGGWELRQVPEGRYRVLAYADVNRTRELEEFEARDTATITVTAAAQPPSRLLSVLIPDTTAPRAGTASAADAWVEVRFDDYLDPQQPLSPAQVTLTGPAGPIAVEEVRVGPPPRAAADTAAADTAGAPRDTARAPARPDTARADTARRDTTPRVPPASQSLFVRPAAALASDTEYRLVVTGVRNIAGLVGGGEVTFRTPRSAPPRPQPPVRGEPARPDTVRPDTVRPDTARRPAPPPGAPPPRR